MKNLTWFRSSLVIAISVNTNPRFFWRIKKHIWRKHVLQRTIWGVLKCCLKSVKLYWSWAPELYFLWKTSWKENKMLVHVLKHEYLGIQDIGKRSDVLTDGRNILNNLQLRVTKEYLSRKPSRNKSFEECWIITQSVVETKGTLFT